MALEKYTAYRNMPFSSETPSDGHHTFVTVRELIQKVTANVESIFMFRAVGTVTIVAGRMYFHEIEDSSVMIHLSLQYTKKKSPFLNLPYAVHVCGYAHCKHPSGMALFAQTIVALSPYLAIRLRNSMRIAFDNFFSQYNRKLENDPELRKLAEHHNRHLVVRKAEELELATGVRRNQLPRNIPLDDVS